MPLALNNNRGSVYSGQMKIEVSLEVVTYCFPSTYYANLQIKMFPKDQDIKVKLLLYLI